MRQDAQARGGRDRFGKALADRDAGPRVPLEIRGAEAGQV
jgi:hypothetical protein